MCVGHAAKAFKRPFAQRFSWPIDAPEDAYTYPRLKEFGYSMFFCKRAIFKARHVTNMQERMRRVIKFIHGKQILLKYFRKDFLKQEYNIPSLVVVKVILKFLRKKPVWVILYSMEICINRLFVIFYNYSYLRYTPTISSKNLHSESS